jgi:hypothetical protein
MTASDARHWFDQPEGRISVLLGKGRGTFHAPRDYPVGSHGLSQSCITHVVLSLKQPSRKRCVGVQSLDASYLA